MGMLEGWLDWDCLKSIELFTEEAPPMSLT